MRQASREELEKVSRVGPKMAAAIDNFFRDKRNQQAIDMLLEAGLEIIPAKRAAKKHPLSRKSFVFTGSLERFSRSDAHKVVESLGGRIASSVSGRTDYVIVGSEPGKKLDQAKTAGVKTLNEKGFIELLREAGAGV